VGLKGSGPPGLKLGRAAIGTEVRVRKGRPRSGRGRVQRGVRFAAGANLGGANL